LIPVPGYIKVNTFGMNSKLKLITDSLTKDLSVPREGETTSVAHLLSLTNHLGITSVDLVHDTLRIKSGFLVGFLRKSDDSLTFTAFEDNKVSNSFGKDAPKAFLGFMDTLLAKLPEKFRKMKVSDSMYALAKAANFPTLEMQDALMKILRYSAPSLGLKPLHLQWGVDDSNSNLVLLYFGKKIGEPVFDKNGVMSIKASSADYKFPDFFPTSVAPDAMLSKQVVQDSLAKCKKEGYAQFNTNKLNVHLFKTEDSVRALINGTFLTTKLADSDDLVYSGFENPSNLDAVNPINVVGSSIDDPNLREAFMALIPELKTLVNTVKDMVVSSPLHYGLQDYLNLYNASFEVVLYGKDILGEAALVEPATVVFDGDAKTLVNCVRDKVFNLRDKSVPYTMLHGTLDRLYNYLECNFR